MGILSVKEVSKSFGHFEVLRNVNFEVNSGEIIGILGPSGSGKSVLIKMIIDFLSPTDGEIKFQDNIKLGFSMQNNSLYDYLSVKQNLIFFSKLYGVKKDKRKERIKFLIDTLSLRDFERVLVKNLSGGTKKRVDIACALINDPDILILDEPFNGLDPILMSNLIKFILFLNKQGKTIIFSSHSFFDLSSICNRFFLVKNNTLQQIKKSDILKSYS